MFQISSWAIFLTFSQWLRRFLCQKIQSISWGQLASEIGDGSDISAKSLHSQGSDSGNGGLPDDWYASIIIVPGLWMCWMKSCCILWRLQSTEALDVPWQTEISYTLDSTKIYYVHLCFICFILFFVFTYSLTLSVGFIYIISENNLKVNPENYPFSFEWQCYFEPYFCCHYLTSFRMH